MIIILMMKKICNIVNNIYIPIDPRKELAEKLQIENKPYSVRLSFGPMGNTELSF